MKKKIFGFLTAVLTLAAVGTAAYASGNSEIQKEDGALATNLVGGEVLYLKPNSNWTQANARFATYFFNNTTGKNTWASMTKCPNDASYYKVTVPTGDWANLIFCRMNPSASANNWDNRWNQTSDLTWPGATKNCYSVMSGYWDSSTNVSSNWTLFTETTTKYTVTFKNGSTNLGTAEYSATETFTGKFFEVEEKRFEGWYTDSALSKPFANGTKFTANTTLYGKYVTAADYTILVGENFFGAGSSQKMYVYMFRSHDTGSNAAFPGELLSTKEFSYFYTIDVDASKSFDKIIFTGYEGSTKKGQTKDLDLSLNDLTTYYVGTQDTTDPEKKYNGSYEIDEISLGYKIFKLGGSWTGNDVTTSKCSSNYTAAKNFYAGLSETNRKDFQTSTESDVVKARTRYEAWCSANYDLVPYEGSVVSARSNVLNVSENNVTFIVVIAVSMSLALAVFIVIKRKNKNI